MIKSEARNIKTTTTFVSIIFAIQKYIICASTFIFGRIYAQSGIGYRKNRNMYIIVCGICNYYVYEQ